ncbi:MAG: hypothetical protein RIR11_2347 [Bacteroidota bacterium]
MLHLYISHAPADKRYVAEFMEWIAPLQVRYNLRIWYDHPEPDPVVPYPWNILFFWYSPRSRKRPYHRKMHEELEQGHIFLFFTQPKIHHNTVDRKYRSACSRGSLPTVGQ